MSRTVPTHSKNRPSLIAHDLRAHVPAGLVYDSLYKRGVLKLYLVRARCWILLGMWLRIGREAGIGGKRHSKDYWHGYRQGTLDARADLKRILETPWTLISARDPTILDHFISKGNGQNDTH